MDQILQSGLLMGWLIDLDKLTEPIEELSSLSLEDLLEEREDLEILVELSCGLFFFSSSSASSPEEDVHDEAVEPVGEVDSEILQTR